MAMPAAMVKKRYNFSRGEMFCTPTDSRVHVKWAVWSCKDAKEGLRADYRLWVRLFSM